MSENHVCVVTEIEGSLGWRFDCKECGRSTGWHRYHLAAKQSWDEALSATGREASVGEIAKVAQDAPCSLEGDTNWHQVAMALLRTFSITRRPA